MWLDVLVKRLQLTLSKTGWLHAVPLHPQPHTLSSLNHIFAILLLAGIGRTGTFCAVDIALARLRAAEYGAVVSAAELKPVVAELRRQRAGMVQTAEQYLFCYQVPLCLATARRSGRCSVL